jgi:hypothetical protein
MRRRETLKASATSAQESRRAQCARKSRSTSQSRLLPLAHGTSSMVGVPHLLQSMRRGAETNHTTTPQSGTNRLWRSGEKPEL